MKMIYKFRPISSEENFNRLIDIINKHRFYAASLTELSDPLEGVYYSIMNRKREKLYKVITNGRKPEGLKICSFSKTYNTPVLWDYYAEQFKGVCFQVEILDNKSFEILEIEYGSNPPNINRQTPEHRQGSWHIIYKWKHNDWKNEKEIRLIASNRYIDTSIKINSIFFGLKTKHDLKLKILRMLPSYIDAFDTEMDFEHYEIKIGRKLN